MAKLSLAETIEQQTQRCAKATLAGAVRAVNSAVEQVLLQIADRGGLAAWKAELGDDWPAVRDVALACKAFVEVTSDLPAIELPEV